MRTGPFIGRLVCPLKTSNSRRLPEHSPDGATTKGTYMKFYPHHIGDFIKDTARLNDSQSMAYLRLIWEYYANEMPLYNDCNAIAFKIGSSASDVEQILRHFFFLHDGKWHQSRCDTVIAEFYAKSEKARTSANIRWEEKKKNANALRTNNERNANEPKNDATHNPIPISKPKVKNIPPSAFDAINELALLGVSLDLANEWIAVRKSKRGVALTKRVIDGLVREASISGISVSQAVMKCCERGWITYDSSYVATKGNSQHINGFKSEKQRNNEAALRAIYGTPTPQTEKLIQGEIV